MVKRRFTDEDDDEPLVEMSEPVMQDVPEDLAESDSDDDASPEDVSNAAVREAALERDIGIKESQIKYAI